MDENVNPYTSAGVEKRVRTIYVDGTFSTRRQSRGCDRRGFEGYIGKPPEAINPMRFLIILAAICAVGYAGEYDLTVEVPAGKFQCFYQPVIDAKHKFMEVDYQVIDGADLNVNFMVLFGAEVLIQEVRKTDGSHKIELKALGDYQICFDNTFSIQSKKVVFFEVFLMDADGNYDDLDLSKFAQNDVDFAQKMQEVGYTISEFHAAFNRIKASFNKIEYYQSILRAYEARDRAIMTANFDRVTFWSCLNSAVLVGVGVLQVYIIRSFFEDHSKVRQLLRN
uniref:GOLD domain-containing protein n=1 Tax=Panagrellus redivivus TaxID=6233 RepID=A0A7E4ZY89_PANRE